MTHVISPISLKLGFLNCKYLQWATLHADEHIIIVKLHHSAMFMTQKNLASVKYDRIPLKYVTVQVNWTTLRR